MVMKKNAMRTNLRQSILKSLGRYLAIVLIIALGASMFVGLLITKSDMVATGQRFMDEQNMFDLRLLNTYGWSQEQLDAVAQLDDVVDAEGLYYMDAVACVGENEEAVYRLYTLPEKINQVSLRGGRMPESADECLADGFRFDDSILGTTLTISEGNDSDTLDALNYKTYTIVGYVATPLYMDMNRGTTSVGSGTLSNYFYLSDEAFDVDYYTEIDITIEGDYAVYSDAYAEATDAVADALEPQIEELAEQRLIQVREDAEQAYEDGVQEYEDGKAEAEQQLADALAQLLDAQEQINENAKQLEEGEQQLEEAKETLKSSQQTMRDSRQALAESKASAYAQLASANSQLFDNYKTVNASLQEVNNGLLQISTALTQLTAGITQLESGLSQLDSGIQQMDLLIGIMDTSISTAQTALNLAKQAPEANLETIAELEAKLAELQAKRDEYAAQREELSAQREQYSAQLEELKSQQSELESQQTQLNATKTQLDAAMTTIDEGFLELQNSQTQIENQFAAAEAQLESGEIQLESAEQQISDSEQELADGKTALEEARAELREGWSEYYAGKKESAEELAKAEQELADAKEAIAEMTSTTTYILDRTSNIGYSSLDSSSDIVQGVSRVFPAFFLLIAALVCITTMTRMIEEERTQIGTLKALGYSNGAIISKYLIYSGSGAVVGCGLGVVVGSIVFPTILWEAYKMMLYIRPAIELRFNWWLCGVVVLAYTAVMLFVTWFCCRRALAEEPAELIRPTAPDPGKKILLEHLPFWNKFSFLNKVMLRNIFRYRQRLAMMLVGIGGCTALLVTGFGIRDSIVNVVDYQFQDITTYDMQVYFSEGLSSEQQAEFLSEVGSGAAKVLFYHQESVKLSGDNEEREIYLMVADDKLQNFIDFHSGSKSLSMPGKDEVLLSVGVADALGIEVGDTITMRSLDLEELTLTVSGIYDNYVYNYAIVLPETIESQWGSAAEEQMALLCAADGQDIHTLSAKISGMDKVMNLTVSEDLANMVRTMLDAMDLVVGVIVFCAGLLAVIVLYNLTNININERIREIATIKVLGFNAKETAAYVFKENMALTGMGAIIGLPLGYLLLRFVISQIKIDLCWFEARAAGSAYVMALVLTVLSACIVDFIFYFRLDKINMAEALKSVE